MLNTKFKIIAALLAFNILLLYVLFSLYGKLTVKRDENKQLVAFSSRLSDSVEYYRDKSGIAIARSKVLLLTLENVKALQKSGQLAGLKKFKGLKKNLGNLESSIEIDIEDKAPCLQFSDVGEIGNPLVDSILSLPSYDSSQQQARHINIEGVVYDQRKRKLLGIRFGKREWFAEFTSNDPNVKILKQRVIKVVRK